MNVRKRLNLSTVLTLTRSVARLASLAVREEAVHRTWQHYEVEIKEFGRKCDSQCRLVQYRLEE